MKISINFTIPREVILTFSSLISGGLLGIMIVDWRFYQMVGSAYSLHPGELETSPMIMLPLIFSAYTLFALTDMVLEERPTKKVRK